MICFLAGFPKRLPPEDTRSTGALGLLLRERMKERLKRGERKGRDGREGSQPEENQAEVKLSRA